MLNYHLRVVNNYQIAIKYLKIIFKTSTIKLMIYASDLIQEYKNKYNRIKIYCL